MIMFEIKLNGAVVAIAGGSDISSISAHIDALIDNVGTQYSCNTSINGSTRGLTGDLESFITWFEKDLSVGDKIEISVIDNPDINYPTPPIKILAPSK